VTKITGTLHEDLCTFVMIYRTILLRMRNVLNRIVEKIKTHCMFYNFFSENRAFYEIMWKSMIEPDRPQMTIYYNTAHAHCMLDN
jgi:hypothetical protein